MSASNGAAAQTTEESLEARMADKTITLEVFRYDPEGEVDATFQKYEVPYRTDWVVLDALNWIKEEQDGTLS